MAGIFDIFKRKDKPAKEKVQKAKVKANQSKEAFFLKPDDAKTFGNIEFMKKTITIKRTFAKTVAAGDLGESVRGVSSMEAKAMKPNEVGKTSKTETTFSSSSSSSSTFKNDKKSSSDNGGMDAFRKMARDIKK